MSAGDIPELHSHRSEKFFYGGVERVVVFVRVPIEQDAYDKPVLFVIYIDHILRTVLCTITPHSPIPLHNEKEIGFVIDSYKPNGRVICARAPKWHEAGKTHDWRNYISDELRAMWYSFTPQQKEAIADNAEIQADKEEWD